VIGSKIEWCDDTVNAWWGCTKVSPGCAHCYAETIAKRVGRDVWGPAAARWLRVEAAIRELDAIATRSDREGRPRRVFMQSMSDLFEDREDLRDPRARVFEALHRIGRRITPLLTTKRAEEMAAEAKRLGWPEAAWALVTVENQEQTKRIPYALQVGAPVVGLSMEPLLEAVDLGGFIEPHFIERAAAHLKRGRYPLSGKAEHRRVGWVIVGGESGPKARPMHPMWARSLRDQCVAAGVPFFFKQHGEWAPICDLDEEATNKLYVSRRKAEDWENQEVIDDLYGRRCTVQQLVLRTDGDHREVDDPEAYRGDLPGWPAMLAFKVGKGRAGRVLDGRTWDEIPTGGVA
jgi:protein gp37